MIQEITEEIKTELQGKAQDMLSQAKEMTIATELENTQAAVFTASLKQEIKRRRKLLRPTKDALDASKKAYQGLVAQIVTPLEEITTLITGKVGEFVRLENARRAELQRVEDEKAAAAQRKADEAYAAKCAKAAEKNRPAPAAPVIAPPRVVSVVSAPAGTSYVEYWSAAVTDIVALCRAVADDQADPSFVIGNQVTLNAFAKIKKREGEILPGVIGVKKISTTQRS